MHENLIVKTLGFIERPMVTNFFSNFSCFAFQILREMLMNIIQAFEFLFKKT